MKSNGMLSALVVTPALTCLVYLGGLAAVQDACKGCWQFGPMWFAMAYELLIILALLLVVLRNRLDSWRMAFLAFFTIGVVLFIQASTIFVPLAAGLGRSVSSQLNAAAAGSILTAIANFFVVAVLGKEEF